MTAVIYARYSSDSQREASIEGQLRDCKDYAERNGITIVGTYIDRAYSAKTDDRPEFQRMVKDSTRKIFDAVLVWKLDRFARNRYDAVYYKRQLEKNGDLSKPHGSAASRKTLDILPKNEYNAMINVLQEYLDRELAAYYKK